MSAFYNYLRKYQFVLTLFILVSLFVLNVKAGWIDISNKSILEDILSIKFVNADTGFCIGNLGSTSILMKTIDGGLKWKVKTFQGKLFLDLNLKNIDTFFISGYSFDNKCGVILRSFNSGEDIEEIYFNDTINPFSFGINKTILLNNNNMFLCGYSGAIFYSEDFGRTWTKTKTNSDSKIFIDIQMLNDSIGYAVGGDFNIYKINNIYKTIDSGHSWFPVLLIDTSTKFHISNIYFFSEDTGFIFGAKDTIEAILKTEDTCKTWEIKYLGNKNMFINKGYFLNNFMGYAVGEKGGIFKTTDAGDNWIIEPIIISETINDICFPIFNDTIKVFYACGNKGTILKYLDIVDVEHIKESAFYLFNSIKLPQNLLNSILNVSVYNVLGETIIQEKNIMINNIIEKINSLNKGCYLLLISEDKGSIYTFKFIK